MKFPVADGAINRQARLAAGQVWVLIGGPPCQTRLAVGQAKSLNECRSCRLTRVANFCNSLHVQDLSIVGHADPDIRI
ncbi:MAG: hypothetical protein WAV28_07935 [Sedimentisphaerales bacterium]